MKFLQTDSVVTILPTLAAKHGVLRSHRRNQALAGALLRLESLARKLERPTVLGDGPNDVIRSTRGDLSLHLKRNLHRRADKPREMRDHLIGDAAGIAADALGSRLTVP